MRRLRLHNIIITNIRRKYIDRIVLLPSRRMMSINLIRRVLNLKSKMLTFIRMRLKARITQNVRKVINIT